MRLRAELLSALPKSQIARELRDMVYAVASRLSTTGIPFEEFGDKLIGDEEMDGVVMAVSPRAKTVRCNASMDFDGAVCKMPVQASTMDGQTVITFFGTKLPESTNNISDIAAHVLESARKEPNWPMG